MAVVDQIAVPTTAIKYPRDVFFELEIEEAFMEFKKSV